ncbi:hypothetical protein [Actinocorallia sp. A-T 12471]|uniref:hypothetical protein n=1 Tax=Actinocorallia sp. A-T 12471 TaxID=3089813 RepID=UPI0029D3AB1B|nr:hypothetical protein [Actinocorallia sp. A-T 12471]MDX6743804.1 hypothetical protein [Actinocorallia sp. A-T 12471]
MHACEVDGVLVQLLDRVGHGPAQREQIRVWARSGVERLTFPDGTTAVFKYAEGPFAEEDVALGVAEDAGLPVPQRLAVAHVPGLLGMLLSDLGPSLRDASDAEGAALAVRVHRVAATGPLPTLDGPRLAAMPDRVAARLTDVGVDVPEVVWALAKVADARAEGSGLPPFGLCHSEWHPTSVHVGARGTHLLDFARAFRGPGLLDLASWHGTLDPPDPDRLAETLAAYVAAGGAQTVTSPRGGLSAARWALGWHRLWAADWFAHQIALGWAQGAEDAWTSAINRHLTEAADLLRA